VVGPAAPPAATAPGPTTRATTAKRPAADLTTGPSMPTVPPVRVEIPALRVSSSLVELGLNPDRTMQVPDDGDEAGWFVKAPTPGALGPAVIAAHVNWKGKQGVFARLSTLRPGDTARVTRRDGSVAVFRVTDVRQYPKNRFPTDAVYGAIDHAGLRLITCGGDFDAARRSYVDNVVVFARLVGTG
jgi:sortase (surface protein transpeptidase)